MKDRQTEIGLPIVRVEPANQEETLVGILIASDLEVGKAQRDADDLVVGLEGGGLLEQGQSLFDSPGGRVDQGQVVARLEVVGGESRSVLEPSLCLRQRGLVASEPSTLTS